MRILLLSILIVIAGQVCYGQVHEESFPSGDPVKSIQIYPNPAFEFLTVKFESPVSKTSRLTFHSIIGNALELEQEVIDDYEIRVKVKDLPIGYYLIVVSEPNNSSRGIYKFLKK